MPSRAARRVLGFRTCALLQARRGSSGRGRHCRRERIQPWSRSTLLSCGTKRRPSDKRQTPHQGPAAVVRVGKLARILLRHKEPGARSDLHQERQSGRIKVCSEANGGKRRAIRSARRHGWPLIYCSIPGCAEAMASGSGCRWSAMASWSSRDQGRLADRQNPRIADPAATVPRHRRRTNRTFGLPSNGIRLAPRGEGARQLVQAPLPREGVDDGPLGTWRANSARNAAQRPVLLSIS